jgi:hypothetical protein
MFHGDKARQAGEQTDSAGFPRIMMLVNVVF